MKGLAITLLLVISTITAYSQNQSTIQADKDSVAAQQIKQLEFLLVSLVAKGDIETYATYLTDDYVRINANGTISTKEQALDGFGKSNGQGNVAPHDLTVRVYGTTAILRGILDITGNDGKKRTSLMTKVFIKRNGKWYMASMQGTSSQ